MFRRSLILVLCGIMVSMILPAQGQERLFKDELKTNLEIINFGEEQAQVRPADLGDEYKYVARFSVEKQYVPWLSVELKQEELQEMFSLLVDKSGLKLPSFDNLRPFFNTEIGGAIRFSQHKEGYYTFDIYGADKNQTLNRAYGVYMVCNFGGRVSELQQREDQLKQQEEYLDNLRMDLLRAQLHVERSEREAQKQYGGLTKEVRTSLESRRWLLEVDLAGLEARMRMAEQMKTKSRAADEELARIKVNTQIELAGIMAQKDKIEEILRMADEYDSQVLPHLEQLSELEYEMARTQIAHEQLQKQLQKNEPPKFKVKDDLIMVFPLKDEGK